MVTLIERLKRREEEAFHEWMSRDSGGAMRLATLLLKDSYEAEDVVQDAFILAFNKLEQLSDDEKLTKWLLSIVVSQCRRRTRTWSFKHLFLSSNEELMERVEDCSPLQLLLTEETRRNLIQTIQRLQPVYREVIALYYYSEYSIKEIADLLNAKENTVKSRLARARKQLAQFLKEGEEDE
ncbi:sigma-70 family RNA polymerase sigma factor [Alkalihalophilus lindianensis]|uniref:Sigma-70 family RNA polymerase sigma factor n=1 Tax=Alkalihalophilus lindianensis TaxID=1630542 RepID=A0ABU3XAN4_9BACI|nr:sigma-70 family RNA polymerase sigma factor [Alkalihalophilus lindianensis]MDV2684883.1 sigma-70 family RNA polymerase sigma factor [Alkalihalophilus lindianensis]